MKIFTKFIITAFVVFAISRYGLIPGIVVADFTTAVVVALVLGVLNIFIRPLLLILTLPVNVLSLGLFTFVINALLFWLVAFFVKGFEVSGFVAAFLGALLITLVKWLLDHLLD
ncbi:MAG: phage holin family protein [bacterium]|nr:phage holin family protein [bacterium]